MGVTSVAAGKKKVLVLMSVCAVFGGWSRLWGRIEKPDAREREVSKKRQKEIRKENK